MKSVNKKSKQNYKALVLDVDGTLVSNKFDGKISPRVRDTILKSNQQITVAIASGRPLERVTFVFDELELKRPCIVSGGAQIVNPVSLEILWEQAILAEDAKVIVDAISALPNKIWVVDDTKEVLFNPGMKFKKPLSFFIPKILEQKADDLISLLALRENLAVNKVVAYHEGHVALHITHAKATKQHAITKVAELQDWKDEEIIGVGDGYNDYPLFKACGLRVAVGNAVTGLKERADYIAPSVEDDGVAHVIEKFVFKKIIN